ncbi:MAG: glycerate kinase [Gemmatimonadetes bacterium]|nr:glycerate kinase [Gemmatimonadota bacterium]
MSGSDLRSHALTIFQAGLQAANPVEAVERHLHLDGHTLLVHGVPYSLREFGRVLVVGMGKASAVMAKTLTTLLGSRISGGLINVKYGHRFPLSGIRVVEAGHPVPDEAGLRGTKEMIRFLGDTTEEDLVFCLISGGGSALSPAPAKGVSLGDKQDVTRRLLDCGATIHEINSVRKHLSRIKGGRLAGLAQPSALVALILSDVIGDDLDTIASGPTVPDRSTFYDSLRILSRYNLSEAIPQAALRHLEAGARGEIPETPKAMDPAFEKAQNVVVGSNAMAVRAAREKARELGYNPLILSSYVEGETREVARVHAAIAKEVLGSGNPVPPPACIISGGETTVTMQGGGKGGRNQEFALASALEIEGLNRVLIMSVGTDGTDGLTDAAGAFALGDTVERGQSKGLDAESHLAVNDSYNFFEPLDDLIITGPTLTNVMDLRLVLVE